MNPSRPGSSKHSRHPHKTASFSSKQPKSVHLLPRSPPLLSSKPASLKSSPFSAFSDRVRSVTIPFDFRTKGSDGIMIDVVRISKRFNALMGLDGLTFHVEHGQCLGVLGPDGAGKSTLLRCLNGQLKPEEGTVTIDGLIVDRPNLREIRRKVGFLRPRRARGLGPDGPAKRPPRPDGSRRRSEVDRDHRGATARDGIA